MYRESDRLTKNAVRLLIITSTLGHRVGLITNLACTLSHFLSLFFLKLLLKYNSSDYGVITMKQRIVSDSQDSREQRCLVG